MLGNTAYEFHLTVLVIIIFDKNDPYYIDLITKLYNNININKNNKNKTTTLKILLMLSVGTIMLIPGGIISVYAVPGDLLLEINNPTPAASEQFGRPVATTPTGDLLVGAYDDNTGAFDAGSAYLFDGTNGSLLLTINNLTPEHGDRFGSSVATTPTGDLLVGAYRDDTGATNAGSAYLFDEGDQALGENGAESGISLPVNYYQEDVTLEVGDDHSGYITHSNDPDDVDPEGDGVIDNVVYDWRNSSSPLIISFIADDPDDLDNVYSRNDILTITFDSYTNMPGGTGIQTKTDVNELFTFTESLGRAYSGKWITPDTFTITIKSVNNAGPPVINGTTVTPSGITSILSIDDTSMPSFSISPVLSGDFGIIP